jgi:glutaredoxin
VCSYCVAAKNLLASKNLDFIEKNIDQSQDFFFEMRQLAPTMRTVPVIFKNNELIGGYTELLNTFND